MTVFRGFKPGVFDVVGYCKAPDCGAPMLSKEARRQGIERKGHLYHSAHGYCTKHMARIRRNGTLEIQPRPKPAPHGLRADVRSREEVLEEYEMVRDEVSSIRQAAERMGMSFFALDRALYRARQDGIRAALPPREQMERAEARGNPYVLPRAH